MKNTLKTKDIVSIALLTALYMALYLVTMMIITVMGPFGHAISPGINGLIAGPVVYFMSRKIGKRWQFSIMTAILMGIFAMMGGGYLPWIVTSMVTAVIADLLASGGKDVGTFRLAIASGIMHVGQAMGAILPCLLFLERYRADWIRRGQTPEQMDAMIKYTTGSFAALATVLTFALAFVGIYLGHLILKKHFQK